MSLKKHQFVNDSQLPSWAFNIMSRLRLWSESSTLEIKVWELDKLEYEKSWKSKFSLFHSFTCILFMGNLAQKEYSSNVPVCPLFPFLKKPNISKVFGSFKTVLAFFERAKYSHSFCIYRINIDWITLPWQMMTLWRKKKTSTGSMLDFLVIIATKAGPKPKKELPTSSVGELFIQPFFFGTLRPSGPFKVRSPWGQNADSKASMFWHLLEDVHFTGDPLHLAQNQPVVHLQADLSGSCMHFPVRFIKDMAEEFIRLFVIASEDFLLLLNTFYL